MAAITTRPMGSGSVTNYFTGGMDLNQFQRPSLNASNYKTQEAADAWNNYVRAGSVRESITPGAMGYGTISKLPNESDDAYWSRRSAAENAFGGGLTGSGGLTNALRREQGLSSGGSIRRSVGGGGGGGGAIPIGQTAPLDFYRGPIPIAEELTFDYEEMGKRAMEANKPYAEQFRQFSPGFEAGSRLLSNLGATMLTGQVSRDAAMQAGRGAAQLGFSTGLGGRTGIGRNILDRDLVGLSSLAIKQQGADLLTRSSQLAQQAMQAMSPISPGQVFGEALSQASYNSQIRNQNALNAYQSQALPGQFDITTGSFVGYQPGSRVTTRPLAPGQRQTPFGVIG